MATTSLSLESLRHDLFICYRHLVPLSGHYLHPKLQYERYLWKQFHFPSWEFRHFAQDKIPWHIHPPAMWVKQGWFTESRWANQGVSQPASRVRWPPPRKRGEKMRLTLANRCARTKTRHVLAIKVAGLVKSGRRRTRRRSLAGVACRMQPTYIPTPEKKDRTFK